MESIKLSRDASSYEYDPGSHGGSRRRERNIPMEAIDNAIESGEAYRGHSGRVLLETRWSGQLITVVINPKNNYIISTFRGTGKKLGTLKSQEQRRRERERKVRNRSGAAYTGGWL